MNTRIPDVYQVSWWPRGDQDSESVKHRKFYTESEAARFLDGISAETYWTKIGKVDPKCGS
jgi:hypothetical protein